MLRAAVGVIVVLVCLGTGCGYHSISNYLPHISSIRIPPVENYTNRAEIGDELTAKLQERFRVKWNAGTDSGLQLNVLDYWIEPRRFDVNNQPEQYRMSVRVDYRMVDNVENRVIASQKDEEFHRDFYVISGRGEEPETEEEARDLLFDDMVDTLYYGLAEQW